MYQFSNDNYFHHDVLSLLYKFNDNCHVTIMVFGVDYTQILHYFSFPLKFLGVHNESLMFPSVLEIVYIGILQ